jgi:hypothetical protein
MRLAGLLIAACVVARGQAPASLASAAKSPYDLARYINSHTGFSWDPMWKTLGVGEADAGNLFPCENRQDCTTELITFLDPDQTILLIHDSIPWDAYLRYPGTPSTGWRFAGAYVPLRRYFEKRHESARVGSKPFLRISNQGASGSDIGSEIEDWFDLTQPDFKPAFSFSPQGWGLDHINEPAGAVNHRYRASATVDEEGPGESVSLLTEISFHARDNNGEYDLGSASYVGVYRRDPGQKRFSIRRAYPVLNESAPIPNQRFETLAGQLTFTDQEILVCILDRLKQIASGPDKPEKRQLRKFVAQGKDTPEKRALQALLR